MEKYFKYKNYKLENGLEVYHIKTNTDLFSMNLGVKIGSKYEKEDEKGLSHFLEHMVFKGTKNRTNIQINEDLENLAGYTNAYTSYSDTVFKAMALNEEFENSLDVTSDLIINPIFPEKEFIKEKEVIISEIRSDLDDMEEFSFQNICRNSFDKSFLKWDIAGDIKTVSKYEVNQIKQFYSKYYRPNNSVIVITSSFTDEYVVDMVEKYFGHWKAEEADKPLVITEKNMEMERTLIKDDFEQSNIIYLFTFHGLTRREELALSIISYSLGENSNSHLFKRLREEHGLTYEVYTDLDSSKDVKTLFIYTALARENIGKAGEIIKSTIDEVKTGELVNSKFVLLMKKILKTGIASTLLDPQHISDYVMAQIVEGRDIYEFEENLKIIESITEEEIIEVANKVLVNPSVQIVLGAESNE